MLLCYCEKVVYIGKNQYVQISFQQFQYIEKTILPKTQTQTRIE